MNGIKIPVYGTFSLIAIAQTIFLGLLISFSSIQLHVYSFNVYANTLLCFLITLLYLRVAKTCSYRLQWHFLNMGLMTLYLFSVIVYILINLPVADMIRDDGVYQSIFDNLPQKFFAATVSYLVGFFVPLLLREPFIRIVPVFRFPFVRILSGGMVFLLLQNWLLLPELFLSSEQLFEAILPFILIAILLICRKAYCIPEADYEKELMLWPNYLNIIALIILLASMVCEYRIATVNELLLLTASGLFFPVVLMICNIFTEGYGIRVSLQLIAFLAAAPLLFDLFSLWMVLHTKSFSKALNTWYQLIIPRRIFAEALALLLAFSVNVLILTGLKILSNQRFLALRLYAANAVANTVLCVINYSLLYGSIYASDQLWNLVINNWIYKMLAGLILL